MVIKGVKVRKSKLFCWRDGNKLLDKDAHGDPIDYNYFVVIRKKDCPIIEEEGVKYLDPRGVKPAFDLAYGATYYGYGKDYKRGNTRITPFYAVYKGTLYTGSIKHRD